ncbi:hypothetical protein LCGC14_1276630 [marine sediment metagenome]|uniref:Uncharacterized protein n=1 Tax=marine sediment metagenome TaxID=412755 RepID=A0A0F9LHN6_9ZZZZ
MTRFENWIQGWLKIAEGIATICSYVYFRPTWAYKYLMYKILQNLPPKRVQIVEASESEPPGALWGND